MLKCSWQFAATISINCNMQHAACNTRNSQLLMVNAKSLCSRFLCVLISVAANNKFNLIFNCRPKGCAALIK